MTGFNLNLNHTTSLYMKNHTTSPYVDCSSFRDQLSIVIKSVTNKQTICSQTNKQTVIMAGFNLNLNHTTSLHIKNDTTSPLIVYPSFNN